MGFRIQQSSSRLHLLNSQTTSLRNPPIYIVLAARELPESADLSPQSPDVTVVGLKYL